VLATTFVMTILAPTSIQANQVSVTVDGRQVNFTDQGPTIVDGRTLVPVRGVFEEMGFEVDWEQDTQTARLIRNSHEVVLTIGSATFITNGEIHTLDVPAQIISGRTMLPIRAVLESVGYSVEWIQASNTVRIRSIGGQGAGENGNTFRPSDGIDENGFWKGITALDYVEIFNYDNLGIPNDVHYVPNEEIERRMRALLVPFPLRIMDRAVVEGDTVSINYIGSIDGVVFEDASTRDGFLDIRFGISSFIDEFVEQLIGYMPGDTVNVEVTFPDDYIGSQAGKEALFVTTINYIVSQGLSELTDEHVFDNLYDQHGWRSISEMKEETHRRFQRWLIEDFVVGYILNEVNVSSIPEKLILHHEQVAIKSIKERLSSFDMTLEEYLELAGYDSLDERLEEVQGFNEMLARKSLILQAVAEHGGFSVNREEIGDFFEKHFGTRDYSSEEEELGLPFIIKVILHDKVYNHIVENAVLL